MNCFGAIFNTHSSAFYLHFFRLFPFVSIPHAIFWLLFCSKRVRVDVFLFIFNLHQFYVALCLSCSHPTSAIPLSLCVGVLWEHMTSNSFILMRVVHKKEHRQPIFYFYFQSTNCYNTFQIFIHEMSRWRLEWTIKMWVPYILSFSFGEHLPSGNLYVSS